VGKMCRIVPSEKKVSGLKGRTGRRANTSKGNEGKQRARLTPKKRGRKKAVAPARKSAARKR